MVKFKKVEIYLLFLCPFLRKVVVSKCMHLEYKMKLTLQRIGVTLRVTPIRCKENWGNVPKMRKYFRFTLDIFKITFIIKITELTPPLSNMRNPVGLFHFKEKLCNSTQRIYLVYNSNYSHMLMLV